MVARDKPETGTIEKWWADRGYGFITPDLGGREIFFHFNSICDRSFFPTRGARVSFVLSTGRSGRQHADEVAPA